MPGRSTRRAGAAAWTAAAVAVLALGGPWWRSPLAAGLDDGAVTISVVGTADLHGRVFADDGRGGLALLGGYLANLRAARAADGGAVILLDAGDTWQGGIESNLSEGALVVDAYNALGFTAAALGNHDFEFGAVDAWDDKTPRDDDPRGALKARAVQARFPFLAANLLDATGRPVAWPNVQPSTLVERSGVRIGVIGVMTLQALSMTLAANVGGLSVAPLAESLAAEATALRRRGAQVVIAVAHAGGVCEDFASSADLSSCHDGAEMFEVVRQLPRGLVDAVVGGHTHSAVAHEVNGVPIVQAYYWGQWFSRVDLVVDRRTGLVTTRRIHPPREVCARVAPDIGRCVAASTPASRVAMYEGRAVAPDEAVTTAMAPALGQVEALRAVPVGVTLDAPILRGSGVDDSALGNLFADALRDAVPGAAAAIGYSAGPGGLRAGLAAGPITQGAVYDTFPFDNRVVRAELSGRELHGLIAAQVLRSRFPGRSLGVSGLRVEVDCHAGDLAIEVRRASGAPIGAADRVVVAITDFMAARLEAPVAATTTGLLVREVVLDWLRARPGPLRATAFGDPDRPRWTRTARAAGGC